MLDYIEEIKNLNKNYALYAGREWAIDSLVHTTGIYSNNIGISFGLEKFSRMITKGGKLVWSHGTAPPEGNIADIKDSFKYLGIATSKRRNLEKYQGLREEQGSMWKLKVTLVPVVIRTLKGRDRQTGRVVPADSRS